MADDHTRAVKRAATALESSGGLWAMLMCFCGVTAPPNRHTPEPIPVAYDAIKAIRESQQILKNWPGGGPVNNVQGCDILEDTGATGRTLLSHHVKPPAKRAP